MSEPSMRIRSLGLHHLAYSSRHEGRAKQLDARFDRTHIQGSRLRYMCERDRPQERTSVTGVYK